jgi:signal transduction histidine kinase
LAEQVRQGGQPLLVPDLAQHPGLAGLPLNGAAAAAAVPLSCAGEQLGALVLLAGSAQSFQARHLPLLATIAHQAALAVSHAQLHARVQHLAVIEERYRLSREIHDGLAQSLGALGWQLEHVQRLLAKGNLAALERELANTRQMVGEAYLEVREAIDGLRLAIDRAGGLAAALAEHVAGFQQRTGITVQLECVGEPVLPPQAELQLLRIVQEGLANVRKHAQARHVSIRLESAPDCVELAITDDGQGFDPKRPIGREHYGLASMRERIQSLGGSLSLATRPGHGTRLAVVLPVATPSLLATPLSSPQVAAGAVAP